jgi:ubiquinone/menaquinone biosynthesis C-methylase UbiE
MHLLDCGCGPGSITLDLAEVVAPGEVVGIDIGSAEVAAASAAAASRGCTNVRFERADVYELPFPDGTFDAAFAHAVLQHLDDPRRALKEMRRVLKPGGVAGIADIDRGGDIYAPTSPLLEQAFALIDRPIKQPHYARSQRRLLLEADFAHAEASAAAHSWGTAEQLREALPEVEIMFNDLVVKRASEEGWPDPATLDQMRTELLAWFERPDAFAASTMCRAIGWVEAPK